MNTLELVADVHSILGEGPAWDADSQTLYWVDIYGQTVHAFDPATGVDRAISVPGRPGTVAPRASGGLIIAIDDGVASLDFATGACEILCQPEPHAPAGRPRNRFNDGKCDPAGRFWIGTMENAEQAPVGALYRVDADLSVHTMLTGITIANGLTWSPDHRSMYYIDSAAKCVWAFDYDIDSGTIANRRTVVEVPPDGGFPDGMTCDAEGMIWVAYWGAWCVKRHDPATGRTLQTIDVPVEQASACCFGGPDLQDLYITTASARQQPDHLAATQPHAGGLYRIHLPTPGCETWKFEG